MRKEKLSSEKQIPALVSKTSNYDFILKVILELDDEERSYFYEVVPNLPILLHTTPEIYSTFDYFRPTRD